MECFLIMEEQLIAPCGMNCALCIAYIGKKNDINKHGFKRKYCEGCIPRGLNCLHMGDSCALLRDGKVRFCYQCDDYPCKRLKSLNKRYSTKYNMSMIENLNAIKARGIENFLDREKEKWRCPQCGESICCHNGLCLKCDIEKMLSGRKRKGKL